MSGRPESCLDDPPATRMLLKTSSTSVVEATSYPFAAHRIRRVAVRHLGCSLDGEAEPTTTFWRCREAARWLWPPVFRYAHRQESRSCQLGFSTPVRKILDRCHGK